MHYWKPIKGFEGIYEVSDRGVVRKVGGRELAQHKDHRGYMTVRLNDYKHRVHRLVARAFVRNTLGKSQVWHKDGDKLNNVSSNLVWLTVDEMMLQHKPTVKNPKGSNQFMEKSRPVSCYSLKGEFEGTYRSLQEAARETGSSAPGICRALGGSLRTHNKRLWRYADVEGIV